jgi:hypothetical protein
MSNPHDIHAQTAQELFGEVTPSNRWLAKNINFMRLYGGKPDEAKLFPHQEDLIAKAKEMTHRAWPGMPRPSLPEVQLPCTQLGKSAAVRAKMAEHMGEPEILDETFVLGKTLEIRIADHLSQC